VTVDTWPAVALGDVLTLTLAPQPVEPQKSYPTLGVYGFGRGVITNKPAVNGHEIAASTLFRVEPGQFIYSKLKAFEGAFAVVPEEAAGRFVTNEFPTFSCRDDQLCAQYLALHWHNFNGLGALVIPRRGFA
jgi:type I restriction enzyme S subunit